MSRPNTTRAFTLGNRKPIFLNPVVYSQPNQLLGELLFVFGDEQYPWILENVNFVVQPLKAKLATATEMDLPHLQWFFDDIAIKVFRAQTLNAKHVDFLPKAKQVKFPQILSSLPLPISAAHQQYTVQCRYRMHEFDKDSKVKTADPNPIQTRTQTYTRDDDIVQSQDTLLTSSSSAEDYYVVDFETVLIKFNYETTVQQFVDEVIET
ncbi:hypothetical protein RFI_25083, partial [Reticulomyxa filosa]